MWELRAHFVSAQLAFFSLDLFTQFQNLPSPWGSPGQTFPNRSKGQLSCLYPPIRSTSGLPAHRRQ